MDAIILAGGRGKRMDDVLPKPLVHANGKPIVAHQLDYLLRSPRIGTVVLALGHRAGEIVAAVRGRYPGRRIRFSIEDEPLGTAGALRQALLATESPTVLVLNCDDVTDADLEALARLDTHHVCVAHPRLPFGLVRERDGHAVFVEKPLLDEWVSCGWYVFVRDALLPLLPEEGSLEYDVFPRLRLRIYRHEGFWQPLNTRKDVEEFAHASLPEALRAHGPISAAG